MIRYLIKSGITVAFMSAVGLSLLAVWDVLTQTNSKHWKQK